MKLMENNRKRGRPLKGISELSEKQVEVLLSTLTCREKAAKLNMSVGWVAKWTRRLRLENDGKRGRLSKGGRPSKGISSLSEKQVEVLLSPITRCEKAAKLDMSFGWVAKWGNRLRSKLKDAFSCGIRLRR